MGIDRTAKACEGDLTEFSWGDCEYCPHCGATFGHGIGAGKPNWENLCSKQGYRSLTDTV